MGRVMSKSRQKKQPPVQASDSADTVSSVISPVQWDQLDELEQLSVVCRLFFNGMGATQIAQEISKKYSTTFKRETTYRFLQKAYSNKWITYTPPRETKLESDFADKYIWLQRPKIVHTLCFEDVAYKAAELLVDILSDLKGSEKDTAHIGFAGGHAMCILAQTFAELLKTAKKKLPAKIVLHALVSGFDVREPTTDPNTFFTLFQSNKYQGIEFEYVGLHTQPMVKWKDIQALRFEEEGVAESYSLSKQINIIVTSATCWEDKDSVFRQYMAKHKGDVERLAADQCKGDMLWLPLNDEGPIESSTERRAMTLMDLTELPEFIQNGGKVLLALGPCSKCKEPKSEILRAILRQENLITHLVVDSQSARQVLENHGEV